MAKKKEKDIKTLEVLKEGEVISKNFLENSKDSNEFSLIVDPNNLYNFTNQEKDFITVYIEYKQIPIVAKILNLTIEDALKLKNQYNVSQEIERLTLIQNRIKFRTQILSIQEIAALLSSYVTDNIPEGEKLNPKDKLTALKMLIDLYGLQIDYFKNPEKSKEQNIEESLKDASVETIKNLLKNIHKTDARDTKKEELINNINEDNSLSYEEIEALKSLSYEELLDILKQLEEVQ